MKSWGILFSTLRDEVSLSSVFDCGVGTSIFSMPQAMKAVKIAGCNEKDFVFLQRSCTRLF